MAEKSAVEALRDVPVFEGLNDSDLQWFAANSEEMRFPAGAVVTPEGEPADWLIIILDGEVRIQRESAGPDSPSFDIPAGGISGTLPFSRMTHVPVVVRAIVATRILRLHRDKFPAMFQNTPQLVPRLVAVMADRIREVSKFDQQRDKLMALGKLSAGLAHELNNPASAARRAAEGLKCGMIHLRESIARVELCQLSMEQREYVAELENSAIAQLGSVAPLDSMEQSDREEELNEWLDSHGVKEGWRLSLTLVEAGFQPASLDAVAAKFEAGSLDAVLQRLTASIAAEKLISEIENSTGRISELVRAIKEYSYMDKNPEQEIDIHQGIDSTLTMLKFRLKGGIEIVRNYDQSLPKLCAHGGELNQVWTNLIDNAADAMNGKGQLQIRTAKELNRILVEFTDNGPGIPPEIKGRIFDPFFTTKGVGEGTGLGLDTVYRIVRSHHGEVKVDSHPGQTRFQIWLPIHKPKEEEQA